MVASACVAWVLLRRRGLAVRELGLLGGAAVAALVVAAGVVPLQVWRIAEDIRHTSQLDSFERAGAGPIQAFLQPYLLDDAARVLPRDATYAAVAGAGVPYPTARKAFPSLALDVLFPRVPRADPRSAEWVIAWGVDPRRLAEVEDVRVVTPRSGAYPPVVVARVARPQ
jgi:hypothetical protein